MENKEMARQQFIRQREAIIGRITRIQTFIQDCFNDIASVKRQHVEIRERHLRECWTELCEIQNKIEQNSDDTEMQGELQQREDMENTQFNLESLIGDVLDSLHLSHDQPPSFPRLNNSGSQSQPSRVKLPTIELPKFSGNYQDWTSYYDLFISLVHNNNDLSPVQKLFYLKASLEGDAKKLLSSFSSTNANYSEAWKVLFKRYQNQRAIVNTHINALFNLKQVNGDIPTSLRKLLDISVENIRALSVLGEATHSWSSILIHMLTTKLDSETRKQWELSLVDDTMPNFTQLQEFLEQRCRALEAASDSRPPRAMAKHTSSPKHTSSYQISVQTCELCGKEHPIYKCETFLKANVNDRINLLKGKSLCFNCLRPGHLAQNCKSSSCRKCNKRHNTLLHNVSLTSSQPQTSDTNAPSDVATHYASQAPPPHKHVLLATALISVKDITGFQLTCRALLDSGSQSSFITEDCAQKLKLQRHHSNTSISVLGQQRAQTPRGTVICKFSSRDNKHSYSVDTLVLPKLTSQVPQHALNTSTWTHINGLQLADPTFDRPGTIDILLGADIVAELILNGKKKGLPGTPIAQCTTLGWILSGCVALTSSALVLVNHAALDIDAQLRQFWEIEELPSASARSKEDQLCEEHFKATHSRHPSGRYMVRLPINPTCTLNLGESRGRAVRCLRRNEGRFNQHPELENHYKQFMDDYIKLGHMSPVITDSQTPNISYYIPHHAVFKEDSSTTKVRVVFDASAKTSTGISLNELLLAGPVIQEGLLSVILRFRLPFYAFTADITKMYRQVLIHPLDRPMQCILWRSADEFPLQEYELNTVTYGTACGSYLATRVLQQLATDDKTHFPIGAELLAHDFYVDDLISGAMTKHDAINAQSQLIDLLKGGGFQLRKWAANSEDLLTHLPPELCDTDESHAFKSDSVVKTLGLHWHPRSDHFSFHSKTNTSTTVTKRTILSVTSQLFDPLGWLAPYIIRPKILMQRLWLSGVSWDDPVPANITKDWMDIVSELSFIHKIQIPRHVGLTSWEDNCELHGFCDSSESAYAAVAYIRTVSNNGTILCHMLCSKTRVAPLKQLSLPRLELSGAYLLARLLNAIIKDMKFKFAHVHAWTDSTIVLAWLAAQPRKWTTFVANRVALIQEIIPPQDWSHVPSKENPADLASRGINIDTLASSQLWWHGPHWLSQDADSWPIKSSHQESLLVLPELRSTKVVLTTFVSEVLPIHNKFSSLTTLTRVTAFCFRFAHNCRTTRELRQFGPISTKELNAATTYWIKFVQQAEFSAEIHTLNQDEPLRQRSHILSLNPFLDDDGILRVGGRLQASLLSYDKKHPILLPQKSSFTSLIISYYHLKLLHAGPQLLLAVLRQKFWIINGRNIVRLHIHKCVRCHRFRAPSSNQLMGNLPSCRIQPARPFDQVGIDYGGPINLKVSALRGRGAHRTVKAYIALLVCMTTKAIHLELVTSLTKEAVLAALQRFTARRGVPTHIYSDCGTNFKGADAELQRLRNMSKSSELFNKNAFDGTTWHFIPPGSPHFGGLWEAGIRSTKSHLLRVMRMDTLTYEELNTLLNQIEACLNSRPLCPISSEPDDLEVLTPGHFLIGQPLTKFPEPDFIATPKNRLTHWRQIQQLQQVFWWRWSSEYLSRLQQRPKWMKEQTNIELGTLVLLKDKNLPPLKWALARVIGLHPGPDKLIRVVTLKTAAGTLKRAITNISPLPFTN